MSSANMSEPAPDTHSVEEEETLKIAQEHQDNDLNEPTETDDDLRNTVLFSNNSADYIRIRINNNN